MEEAQGHVGGIWALANKQCSTSFTVIESTHQCITLQLSNGAASWICSSVYASPNYAVRCMLWDYLSSLCSNIQLPWIMIGDFNDVIVPLEQHGGNFSYIRVDIFSNMLNNYGMLDLEFFGTKFT